MKKEQIQQFQLFVRAGQSKLDANRIVKLKKHCFVEYLQKIKHFAGNQVSQPKLNINETSQNKKVLKTRSKSVYYNQKAQLSSIKQLIFFASQSRKQAAKRKILERRKSIQNYLKNAEKQIQTFRSSNSVKNLRLTMKSAQKTLKKYKQKIMFNPQLSYKRLFSQIQTNID